MTKEILAMRKLLKIEELLGAKQFEDNTFAIL
jgi:hypothetical protein